MNDFAGALVTVVTDIIVRDPGRYAVSLRLAARASIAFVHVRHASGIRYLSA
jgi:hypothetical protein